MITTIPNQPIKFPATGENSLAEEIAARCDIPQFNFCQIYQCNDEINFQVLVSPTDVLGWYIRNTKTDTIVYMDLTEGHVTYNGTHTVAWVTFSFEQVLPGACDKKCFDICIFDGACANIDFDLIGVNVITNGDFSNGSTGWTLGNTWAESGGIMCASGNDVLRTLAQSGLDPLEVGCKYRVTFDLLNYVSAELNVFVVGGGTQQIGANIITEETHVIDFVAQFPSTQLSLRADIPPDAAFDFCLDNVTLELLEPAGFSCSEPLNLQTSFNECTLLMKWNNLEDAFGFEYTSFPSAYAEYSHVLRIRANLWHALYPKDKTVFTDSTQASTILYSKTSRQLELSTDLLPEYIHDALSIGLEHDSFEIKDETKSSNFKSYVALEEDYEPVWEENMIFGKVIANLLEKTPVKRENNNC